MNETRTSGPRVLLRRLRELMAAALEPQERLDRIVREIASNMVAEVCSLYVLRADSVLELYATEGLNPKAVHLAQLRLGQGLVGTIAASARPLNLSDAQQHPAFAYLPDLGRAFVALAARRGELGGFEAVHFEGHTLTGNEVKATAEAITGRRLKLRGVPWPLLRAAGLVMPMMREVAAMSYLWRMPHSLDGSKFRALVPDFAATPPELALRETVEALGLSAGAGRQAA